MKRVVQLGVRNPVFVNILLAMILFGGVASWLLMVREVLPAFTFDMVLVQVPYPGADPQEVEEGIAIKLEEAIQGTEGVKNYYTTSREHMAIMRIELVPRSDVQRIKDEITERIRSIPNLPVDAEDPLISEVRIDSRVLSIAVFGDVPERQLKDLAEEIREDLLQEPGISQVSISGARDYEISIEVSEEALQRFGLTLAEVTRLVREASQNYPGGTLRSDGDQIAIRTVDRRYTGQEFANIVLIAGEGGASVRLGDVATVHDGFVDEVIIGRFNGQRTVMVDISKTREEDALKIADTVDRYIARRNATLPPEIRLQKFFDSSRLSTNAWR